MPFTDADRQMMLRAIELARQGEGHVEPNPMVGCVIANAERIVAEGWHRRFGDVHAEVEAINRVPPGENLSHATLYVSLEPCCHHGKTPPCTQAITDTGIGRVVIGAGDPFPQVDGAGIEQLKAAGITVAVGCETSAANELLRPYKKRVTTGLPWVIAKWAMTLDGKIATHTGDSQWISCKQSRVIVHELRGRMDAIVVGKATAETDDPLLTARPPGPRIATRVVVDGSASLSPDSQLVGTVSSAPVIVAAAKHQIVSQEARSRVRALEEAGCEVLLLDGETRPTRVHNLLKTLGARDCTNVLIEGGGELLGSCLDAGQIDEVHAFVAPRLIGGANAIAAFAGEGRSRISDALELDPIHVASVGTDVYLHGRRLCRDGE